MTSVQRVEVVYFESRCPAIERLPAILSRGRGQAAAWWNVSGPGGHKREQAGGSTLNFQTLKNKHQKMPSPTKREMIIKSCENSQAARLARVARRASRWERERCEACASL